MGKQLIVLSIALVTLVQFCLTQDISNHCEGEVLGTEHQGRRVLSHQYFPNNYLHFFSCSFSIKAPVGQSVFIVFEHFHLEDDSDCRFDHLTIRDGSSVLSNSARSNGRMCGNTLPSPLRSSGSEVKIRFDTDASVARSGFAFRFYFCATECCNVTYLSNEMTSGTATTPNFPRQYPPNSHCTNHIISRSTSERIKLTFTSFNIERNARCEFDWVRVRDGLHPSSCTSPKFCDNNGPPSFVSSSNSITIEFYSDGGVELKGYAAKFNLVTSAVSPAVDSCQLMQGCCHHRCTSVRSRAICSCPPGRDLMSDTKSCGCPDFCQIATWKRLNLFAAGTRVVPGCNSTGFGGVLPTGGVVADVTPSSVYVRWDSGVSEWHDLCRSGSVDVSLSDMTPARAYLAEMLPNVPAPASQRSCGVSNGGCDHICRTVMDLPVCQCLEGYFLAADELTCERNICEDNLGGCSDFCTPLPNETRTCSCSKGFKLKENQRDCIDIDECGTPLGRQCEQRCENNVGSYRCECPQAGYTLSSDGHNCTDIDECLTPSVHHCAGTCVNTRGSFFCECGPGFILSANERTCEDINECFAGPGAFCDDECVNTPGSFRCSCRQGSRLSADNRTCTDIRECEEQADIILNQANCLSCVELQPGYACATCRSGYALSSNRTWCNEVDECSRDNGGCLQQCTNTAGSFLCSCFQGYSRVSFFNARVEEEVEECINIDECAVDNAGCSDTCTDTAGSYVCSCPAGALLASNRKTCVDINECRVNNGGCMQGCRNTDLSYNCFCRRGFAVDPNNASRCLDVNECNVNNGGCRGDGAMCSNLIGSFQCWCEQGYELSSDGVTCSDTDECAISNGNCSQLCVNSNGSYECQCLEGFRVSSRNPQQCEDIDECVEQSKCNQTCTNLPGTFFCSCDGGYELLDDGSTCLDIDECSVGTHRCQQTCTNNDGGYTCSCLTGYRLNGNSEDCDDIDECGTEAQCCQGNCSNTAGSYRCSCPDGFYLDQDGCSCQDIPECSTNNGGCEHDCIEERGSYRCECRAGYAKDRYNSTQCHDINECHPAANTMIVNSSIPSESPCDQRCHNTQGSYECACRELFKLRPDGRSCERCPTCDSFTQLAALVGALMDEVRLLRTEVESLKSNSRQEEFAFRSDLGRK